MLSPNTNPMLRSLELLWIPSTNVTTVTCENEFCLCTKRKYQSDLCLKLLHRPWTPVFAPRGLKAFLITSSHSCIGVHIPQFSLDLGLLYSASMLKYDNKIPTEEISENFWQFISSSTPKDAGNSGKRSILDDYFASGAKSFWILYFSISFSTHSYARTSITQVFYRASPEYLGCVINLE